MENILKKSFNMVLEMASTTRDADTREALLELADDLLTAREDMLKKAEATINGYQE